MIDKLYSATRYIFVGGIGFLINISIFWMLINYTSIWYIHSAIISFILSTFIGFNLHRVITYSDKTKINSKKIIYYYVLNIVNIIINALLIFVFVEYLNVIKVFSLIISNILISIYSYFIYKKLIFK
jgi:putative flippase GtrA